jgi:hypothetical protein
VDTIDAIAAYYAEHVDGYPDELVSPVTLAKQRIWTIKAYQTLRHRLTLSTPNPILDWVWAIQGDGDKGAEEHHEAHRILNPPQHSSHRCHRCQEIKKHRRHIDGALKNVHRHLHTLHGMNALQKTHSFLGSTAGSQLRSQGLTLAPSPKWRIPKPKQHLRASALPTLWRHLTLSSPSLSPDADPDSKAHTKPRASSKPPSGSIQSCRLPSPLPHPLTRVL